MREKRSWNIQRQECCPEGQRVSREREEVTESQPGVAQAPCTPKLPQPSPQSPVADSAVQAELRALLGLQSSEMSPKCPSWSWHRDRTGISLPRVTTRYSSAPGSCSSSLCWGRFIPPSLSLETPNFAGILCPA